MCLRVVVVDVLEKWAQHRAIDSSDDNVAGLGSEAINRLVTNDTRAPWLAAGAEGVLRGITAGTSEASDSAKRWARSALNKLRL